MDVAVQFARIVQAQVLMLWPYWFSGLVVGALMRVYGFEQWVARHTGTQSQRGDTAALWAGAAGGVLSPLCLYGAMPIMGALQRSGIAMPVLVAFLVASPLLNPNLFVYSLALGWPMALVRLATALALGFGAGWLVRKWRITGPDLRFSDKQRRQVSRSWAGFWNELGRSVWFTGRYFLLGVLLAAAVDLWVPKTLLMQWLGDSNPVAILAGAFLGVPLYACGGGTIPLLRELLYMGVDPGVLVAFMLAGPATKAGNLTAIAAIGGRVWLWRYVVYNLAGAFILGYLVHFVWWLF